MATRVHLFWKQKYYYAQDSGSKMEVQGEAITFRGAISLPECRESVGLSDSGSEAEAGTSDAQTTPAILSGRLKYTPKGPESGSFGVASLSQTRSPHQVAELIHARSRILQLEGEVLGLQRAAKRARIEGEEKERGKTLGEQVEQLHKLELERCSLLEEMAAMKNRLTETEKDLSEKTRRLSELTATSDRDARSLREQLNEVKSTANVLYSENNFLKTNLSLLQQRVELGSAGLGEVQETYDRSVEVLRARVKDLESVESKLHHAEAKAQELEHKLRQYKQDSHFVEVARSKVLRYDELERQHEMVCAENTALREKSDNIELLRYQVQSLQEQCGKHKEQERRLAQLEIENQELKEGRRGTSLSLGGGGSPPALQYRISDLQRREVVLLSRLGELETRVKLEKESATTLSEALSEARQQLAREQENSRNKEEKIQRLERRLLFVTKERDGCVNVLNSYKLDAGVDALLKENLTELEQQLARAKDQITVLEGEVDAMSKKGHLGTQVEARLAAYSSSLKTDPKWS